MTAPRRGDGPGFPDLKLRLGTGALLVLLALFALLLLAPLNPGAVRVLGVSLSWWYGGILAPLLAVLITVSCLKPPGVRPVTGPMPATSSVSVWITPALLFSVPAELLTRGSEGLWIALLVVVAPLLGLLLVTPPRDAAPPHPASTFSLALMGFVLLWANLLLVGDVARSLGLSRPTGILVVAGSMFVVTAWAPARRRGLALALPALLALLIPLGVVVERADRLPLAAWSHAASLPAFRFPSESPWVTEGRPVAPRPGTDTLLFEEEHRVTSVAGGPLRILVSDRGRVQIQEWTLAAGQSVTVRPGDRLVVEPGRSLKFEANKRIPGAPASGIRWADPPRPLLSTAFLSVLGSGLTILGGATALLASERSLPISRAGAAIDGAGYVLALAWALGWATYTAVVAPELFLGGITPEKLFELPALALRGSPWGPSLDALVITGAFFALLTSASALRSRLAPGGLEGRDLGFWGGMLGLASLGSFWPLDPWRMLLMAFGLGASTLAPLAWVGIPRERPRAISMAVGIGLVVFIALALAGQILPARGVWAQMFLSYPALAASPIAAFLLWRARRLEG